MKLKSSCRDILFALTLCMSSAGVVQAAECKYAENSVDKSTQAMIVITKWEQLTHWAREVRREMTAYVSASSYGGEKYLRLRIEYVRSPSTAAKQDPPGNAVLILEGGELMIAMSDGVVLKLPAYKGVAGNTIYDDPHPGWLTTKAMIMYELDAGTADALTAQSAKALRVMTDSGHHDVRIHKSNVDDIRRAIECVQE